MTIIAGSILWAFFVVIVALLFFVIVVGRNENTTPPDYSVPAVTERDRQVDKGTEIIRRAGL